MILKKIKVNCLGVLGAGLLFANSALATPIIMQGDFVRTAVSDDGTLGYGSNTSPGLLHDPTGTSTFGDDYLTPGTPLEIFTVFSNESGLLINDNSSSSDAMTGILTDTSVGSAYNNAVNWAGTFGSLFDISTDTYFNNGDERVSFTTTITALSDLTGLQFLRAIDPDPDVDSFGSFNTINGRGFGSLSANDWVHSEGASTGLTLGLYSDSSVTHNTGVSSAWSNNPATYLAGTNDGDGDYTIGIAFDLGSLLQGDSISFTYHYVMGDSLSDVGIPTDVPEPTSIAILALGLIGFSLRRKKA
jgi:hypothetical protein